MLQLLSEDVGHGLSISQMLPFILKGSPNVVILKLVRGTLEMYLIRRAKLLQLFSQLSIYHY